MVPKRLLQLSNRRVRILVGLLLAGLFCIQCTRTEAFKGSNLVAESDGKAIRVAPDTLKQLEQLAKTDHVALLNRCLKHYDGRFRDYTCTLVKQERLRGKLRKEQWVNVKFLDDPFSVAMAWTKNAGLGDRVLYVEGKWGGNMLVRPTSRLLRLAGTAKRKPDGKDARKYSLRTVDRFGFERSLHSLLEFYVKGKKNGVLKEAFGGYANVAGRHAIVLIRYLPDTKDYPSYRTNVFIDTEHLVPICVEGKNEAGDLICRYVYKDVKFNVGLSEAGFTPKANGMAPPRK